MNKPIRIGLGFGAQAGSERNINSCAEQYITKGITRAVGVGFM